MSRSRVRENQAATTRAAILDGSRRLFVDRGYFNTSIEDIVAESGVGTRGALYHHFSSKTDLFEEVYCEVVAEFMAMSDALIDDRGDHLDRLRHGLLGFLAGAANVAAVQRIILIDGPAVLGADRWRALQSRRGVDAISDQLALAISDGAVAAQDVDVLAQLLLAVIDEAAMLIAKSDDPVAARENVSAVVNSLISGLRVR
ncbi:TetR family transcriptional regulator [Mycobacterium sp. 236(2023)]|uniref:TetR/AcrR family transcriptional regulator n=1 Tax=Mycobacterium sp. 236(2023) TaxID=3038163 RepID=UPI00241578D0|nr:TetR family transcriptional regulator [Mycobacterium sp. 236(2023)]MDG4668172.1 TetR family transcriptional regulator [Mycobacterium sp. 236(2023)]